jgi:hypothetical protein
MKKMGLLRYISYVAHATWFEGRNNEGQMSILMYMLYVPGDKWFDEGHNNESEISIKT